MSTWPSTSTRCRSRGAGMPTSMACTATPIVITAIVSSFNTFCKLTWTQNRRSHAYTTATPGGLSLADGMLEHVERIGIKDYLQPDGLTVSSPAGLTVEGVDLHDAGPGLGS